MEGLKAQGGRASCRKAVPQRRVVAMAAATRRKEHDELASSPCTPSLGEEKGMPRQRQCRASNAMRFPAKLEASTWAEEMMLRRAIADSIAMTWQQAEQSKSADISTSQVSTLEAKSGLTPHGALGSTRRSSELELPSEETRSEDVCDPNSGQQRVKRRKVSAKATIARKRKPPSELQGVSLNNLEVKEWQKSNAAALDTLGHASVTGSLIEQDELHAEHVSSLPRPEIVLKTSADVHLGRISETGSGKSEGARDGAKTGHEGSWENAAQDQEQQPCRTRRVKRRPAVMDMPSKEEEAMLRRALSNSLAITRREQSTFNLINEAPVYNPSDEEFADPVSFLESIRSDAEQYGVCKVIPPEGWDPPFCLDPSTRFTTRKQKVHRLQQGEGFCESQEYSLEEYKAMALQMEQQWIDRVGKNAKGEKLARILEQEFWRIVETETEEVEVDYGSDLMVGSGFPQPSKSTAEDKYAQSPWNLLNLPRLEGSLLQFLDGKMPGVTVPWMYIGMIFTAFCFHTEDNFLYSVNYHHLGAPKTWYGVPAAEAANFERAMRQKVPALFAKRPDLLHELVTAVSPTHLLARKVPLYRVRQLPGEFVITYPRAYHAGFNHGFNCAEAVNFAPVDWLPFGAAGTVKYRRFHKTPALDFHELLCRAAQGNAPAHMAPWLEEQLGKVLKQQSDQRGAQAMEGTVRSRQRSAAHSACAVCQGSVFLAAVTCGCRAKKQACLQCAPQFCSCGPAARTLLYTYSLADLEEMLKKARLRGKGQNQRANLCAVEGGRLESSRSSLTQARLESYRLGRAQRAELWVQQAEKILKESFVQGEPSIFELLLQAEEFMWGGSDMDAVRSLFGQLERLNEVMTACSSPLPLAPVTKQPRSQPAHKKKGERFK